MKPNIAIITSGYLPLPPVKGGAVENLVQLLADENEQKNKLDLTIFSIYDKNAKDESVNYKNTHYVFIKIPVIIQYLDLIIYFIFSKFESKLTTPYILTEYIFPSIISNGVPGL